MRIDYPSAEFIVTVTRPGGDPEWHEGSYAECCEWLKSRENVQSATLSKVIARSTARSGDDARGEAWESRPA